MNIGRIIGLYESPGYYARVQDEYGNTYSVGMNEIPDNAREGDEYAYRVSFQSDHGNAITLRKTD